MYKKLMDSERELKEIWFDSNTGSLKQGYLDIFEGIESDVMYTAQCDKNCDIGTTYLGMPKMTNQDDLKAEHKTPITEDCYMPSKMLGGTDCKILLDMTESKSFMS